MRLLRKLIATGAVVASATALAVLPALADPITSSGHKVTPRESDVVGTGSDTIEFVLDQLSIDYNASHATKPHLYSWDALNPNPAIPPGDPIKTKFGCVAIPRPNGSSAGILSLTANAMTADHKHFCIDYARSSRGRTSSDPPKGSSGIVFVALAKDAVTYATNSGSNAPTNLTKAQLNSIYTCTATTWNQVGGTSTATIDPQLPQTSSGTRKFFLTAIGVVTPGGCVGSTAEENEGVNAVLKGPNVIFPYSVGKYIAEKFHSAKCGQKPTSGQNRFGCDNHGTMLLRKINGTAPTIGTGRSTVINPHFTPNFIRTVYAVVRWASTHDNIPRYLEPIFASSHAATKGWICSSTTAHRDLINYGFLPTPFCGTGS